MTLRIATSAMFIALLAGILLSPGQWTPAQAEPPECSDGVDNDGDGLTDYDADPDCASEADDSEGHGDPPCAFNGTDCDGMVIRYRPDRDLLAGAVGASSACMAGRPILLKKARDGEDRIMRMVQTDGMGEWSTPAPDRWSGRFYAVAQGWTIYDDSGAAGEYCKRRVSQRVRIP